MKTVVIFKKCNKCEGSSALKVSKEDYFSFVNNGVFVQDAFPYLSVGERELLISSTCGKCFDEMFGNFE